MISTTECDKLEINLIKIFNMQVPVNVFKS